MPHKLRAVEPSEKPQKKLTVTEAAALNDHREMLLALKSRIARQLVSPSCSAVALAALTRQMVLISKELSVLDSRGGEDAIAQAANTPDEAWSGV